MRTARRIFTALRPALPPRIANITAGVALVFFELGRYFQRSARSIDEIATNEGYVLLGLALFHGFARVLRRHPIARTGYANWLAATPWQPGRPLPLGPVHPYWGDVVVIGLIYLVAQRTILPHPLLPLLAFVFAYAVALTAVNALGDAGPFAYVSAIVLAIGLSCVGDPPVALMLATGAMVVGLLGLGVSLDRFPWDHAERGRSWPQRFARAARDDQWLAWPYTHIGPTHLTDPREIDEDAHGGGPALPWPIAKLRRAGRTVLYVLPVAAWVWAVTGLYLPPVFSDLDGSVSITCFALIVVTITAALYPVGQIAKDHKPPIGMWVRLFTGRLIIPAHDVILLAFFAALAVAVVAPPVLLSLEVEPALAFAFSVMLIAVAHEVFAVDAATWKLTAPCRIEPAKPKKPRTPAVLNTDLRELSRQFAARRR